MDQPRRTKLTAPRPSSMWKHNSLHEYLASSKGTLEEKLSALRKEIRSRSKEEQLAWHFWWRYWARPKQLPPEGEWSCWVLRSGRGFGKSRAGAMWAHERALAHPGRWIAFVARTPADARDYMIEGPGGLLRNTHPTTCPHYEPSKRRVTWSNGSWATVYCTTPETLALTRSGWKGPAELQVGEEVWALDTKTGKAWWSPVTAVNVFTVADHPMIYTDMHCHSSVVTDEHRWPLLHRPSGKIRWCKSLWEANTKDAIIAAAKPKTEEHGHRKLRYTRMFAELIGWFTTEGNVRFVGERWTRSPAAKRMVGCIFQSHKVNVKNVARIDRVLTSLYGPAVSSLKMVRRPAWARIRRTSTTVFTLNHELMREIMEVCRGKDKVVDLAFVTCLTSAARRGFLRACLSGDGWYRSGGQEIGQKVSQRLDAIEVAAIMEGFAVTRRMRSYRGKAMDFLSISKSTYVTNPVPNGAKRDHRCAYRYSGVVWCPTTQHGTWLAKHKGSVFYTGNSDEEPDQLRGFSGDTAWLDEFAKFVNTQETWDNLQFGMREISNDRPRILITTTPRPLPILSKIEKMPTTVTVTGSSFENVNNLDPTWFADVLSRYEGTRLGRQEISGEILDDVVGALWTRATLDKAQMRIGERPQVTKAPPTSPHYMNPGTNLSVMGVWTGGQ